MILNLLSGQINILVFISWLSALVIAVIVHEFAHAWTAWKLGDPTAKLLGRLTLNPRAHFEPLGTLLLLLTGFGWGKPVPLNPHNFQDPRKDVALVSLSGPISNLLLAATCAAIGHVYNKSLTLLLPAIILNLRLAIFNLLPFAPLDGFQIVSGTLPRNLTHKWEGLRNYGALFLLLTLLPLSPDGNSLLEIIISPIQNLLINLIL